MNSLRKTAQALRHAHQKRYFTPAGDYTRNGCLLVVVPHQDDETIVAAGGMQRTIAKGGSVHVVYTVDGVNRGSLTPEEREAKIVKREQQARTALEMTGVPSTNVRFLRYENEIALTKSENMVEAATIIAGLIQELDPYAIVTTAYEGGHIDHDTTNYVVAHAAKLAIFPRTKIFEAPTYNRYYLRDTLKRVANDILSIDLPNPPRFVPSKSMGLFLDMTPAEIAHKAAMFEVYDDWDPPSLIKAFGTPDRFRELPEHNYAEGPYDRTKTIRHWLARLRHWGTLEPHAFFRELTGADYRKIFSAADRTMAEPLANASRE